MAEEMTNGNDGARHYQDAMTAQLGERVTNLGRRQSDLESEMRSGFKQMESAVSSLGTEMRTSVASLSTNIAERNRPQWQAMGVMLAFCGMLGGLAYWPINAATTDLKTAVLSISENMVTQKEMEWRSQRGAEDRKRSDDALTDLRTMSVTRNEWSERNHARDGEIAELSRRIDELRQQVGGIYGATDVIKDLQSEVKMLRQRQFEEAISQGRRAPQP
ncbi:hypothetical protein [Rhizobium leguminosarum]|uniref:hypothetical protein n=1 Tax=Rhizobium leguminosarum TaxID=384 RepID=UPI001C972645|nr:hypothetical protein [Rhizobium leguminosarum]MBY5821500.1 hypothetical protein [Rhizobium leguminosarum]